MYVKKQLFKISLRILSESSLEFPHQWNKYQTNTRKSMSKLFHNICSSLNKGDVNLCLCKVNLFLSENYQRHCIIMGLANPVFKVNLEKKIQKISSVSW